MVTIVWSGEDSEDPSSFLIFIAFLFTLVGADEHFYKKQTISELKFFHLLNPLSSKNLAAISGPNYVPTPLLLGDRPLKSYGSDQSNSHIIPLSGGSRFLSVF